MIKKLTFVLATLLLLNFTTNAQTFELDQVKQFPSIDESNMKTIAFSVQKLFDEAIKEPKKNSTINAVNETVYGFYDTNGDNNLDKVNPLNGKQYTDSDSENLKQNNKLLFNLIFDSNGNLVVPEKIYIISYSDIKIESGEPSIFGNRRTEIKKGNLISLEFPLTENIKSELSKVVLKNTAKADINSLTGGLNSVMIKIPFNLSYGFESYKSKETVGKAVKKGEKINISINRHFKGFDEENKFINMLKEQTDILEYKKGEFDFVIEFKSFNYNIDINILRDTVWSSQPKNFSVITEKVKTFSGEGKKINK